MKGGFVDGGLAAARSAVVTRFSVFSLLALFLVGVAVLDAETSSDLRLLEAVRNGDREAVRILLENGAEVDAREPDGATALHWAAHRVDPETASLLISYGADLDIENDYGITPLALACENGSAELVDALLQAGANARAVRPTGETALMTCSRTGNAAAVKALLSHGADPGAKESEREQTALMWAAAQNHREVIQALIDAGAHVQARTKTAAPAGPRSSGYSRRPTPESYGFTALLFAAKEGAREAIEVLVTTGADVNDVAGDGTSVLQVAMFSGHWDLVPFLLERGADPNADGPGYGPLHWAAGSWEALLSGAVGAYEYQWLAARGPGKLDLVKTLLAHGADPNAKLEKAPPTHGYGGGGMFEHAGATPFVLAGKSADVSVMRALLEAGADPLLTSDDGTTALITAAGLGQTLGYSSITYDEALAAVKVALEVGIDVNASNQDGETALHGAAYFGADPVVDYLVGRGAQVNARNRLGLTPMTVSQGYGGGGGILINPSTVELLRQLGGVGDVDMATTPIESIRLPCPLPVLYFSLRNPSYGSVYVTTTPATKYTNGACEDIQVGTSVRVRGIRETDADKSWDGSVVASEIEIVQ
jgi:ankyrin repeat protein